MRTMLRLRRALGPIAAAWLLIQAGTLVLATAAFGFDAVTVKLIECTCAHGTGHNDCPMHHQPAPSRPGFCQLQYGDDSDAAVLGSLMGQIGLVPAPACAAASRCQPLAVLIDAASKTLRPPPPDPPPPRA